MALASVGWELTVTLVDQGGNTSNLRFDLVAADYTTASLDVVNDIIPAIDQGTDAALSSYRLIEKFEDAAVDFGTGEAENVALITAKIAGAQGKYANIRIPAPVDAMFVAASGPDYNTVNPSANAASDWVDLYSAAVGAVCLISDGEQLEGTAGTWYGKRIHRGSRRG